MIDWRAPRATEIDKKLRDDFRRMIREYGVTSQETDPVLAVLFRSFAVQLEQVYKQAAETIPGILLNELLSGIGARTRRPRPAQTIIRFSVDEGPVEISEGAETIGQSSAGERLTFSLDHSLRVSTAQLAVVLLYEDRQLKIHQGNDLSEELEQARPSFEPVSVDLGLNPAIFLAFDLSPEEDLSRHGLYFELAPQAAWLAESLRRGVWSILDDRGFVQPDTMMKNREGAGGIRLLTWVAEPVDSAPDPPSGSAGSFYGGRVFVFPTIPEERRFLAACPRGMASAFKKMLPDAQDSVLLRPRAWVRIALTSRPSSLDEDLVRIVPHCMSARNLEVLNQTIRFEKNGTSVPIEQPGSRSRRLVEVVSIKGESGLSYEPFTEFRVSPGQGRFRVRTGRLELEPGIDEKGNADAFANVRLLLTDGALANAVPPSGITEFSRARGETGVRLANITAAAGGSDGEEFGQANQRFASLLLSRNRLITQADLEAAVRAYDPRISSVARITSVQRGGEGLERVIELRVQIPKESMDLPAEETALLQHDLEVYLRERALLGLNIRVLIQWT